MKKRQIFGRGDGWPFWLLRSTVHCSLMRKAQWKARGQQSCRAQHARRSRMPGTCRSPFWLGLKHLQNSYLNSAGKFQKIDNGTFSRSLLKQTVLSHHFITKWARKIKITKDNPSMGASSHCPKYHSSARPWEGAYCTGLVFHFHLFHEGKKENKVQIHTSEAQNPQPPLPQLPPDGFPHPRIPPHLHQCCREVADLHLPTSAENLAVCRFRNLFPECCCH